MNEVEKLKDLYCKWCPREQECDDNLTLEEKRGCLASGGFADELEKAGKDQCAYCGKAPDGAMLTMGNLMAHVPCVILKLNELLNPNYEGFGPADEIVGFLSRYVI